MVLRQARPVQIRGQTDRHPETYLFPSASICANRMMGMVDPQTGAVASHAMEEGPHHNGQGKRQHPRGRVHPEPPREQPLEEAGLTDRGARRHLQSTRMVAMRLPQAEKNAHATLSIRGAPRIETLLFASSMVPVHYSRVISCSLITAPQVCASCFRSAPKAGPSVIVFRKLNRA